MKTITTQEIKARCLSQAQIWKDLQICSQSEARDAGARVGDFSEQYAAGMFLIAIKMIMKAHKRANPMADDEVADLAARMARKYKQWTFGDVKVFADMVIATELGDELKSVDIASIMLKAKAYEQLRAVKAEETRKEVYVPKNPYNALWERIPEGCIPAPDTEDAQAYRERWCAEYRRQYGLKMNGQPNKVDKMEKIGWFLSYTLKVNNLRA